MSSVSFTLGSDVLFDRQLLQGRTIGLVCNPASINAQVPARHRSGRTSRRPPRRHLRPAARLPLGRAGQHDRDAARRGRAAARADLLALQRHARADRRDARRASTRWSSTCRTSARASTPTSTRWRTACAAARGTACRSSSATGRTRSAASPSKGPMLEPGFESFVGQFPIPMRHGMTIGELARLFNEQFGIGAKLEVVAMHGLVARDVLRRHRAAVGDAVAEHADARQRHRLSRARCCSKARTCPKGRGTTRPFELVGAPWVDAGAVCRAR